MTDLFGDPVYDAGPRLAGGRVQATLDAAGLGWQIAMHDWSAASGIPIEAERMDGTFRASGRWWTVERDQQTGELCVLPLLTSS